MKLNKKISYKKKFGVFVFILLVVLVLILSVVLLLVSGLFVFSFILLFWVFDVVVSSLNTEAIFNIERMLCIIGRTSFTTGMASFTTPRVLETLFNIPDQFNPFIPDNNPPAFDSNIIYSSCHHGIYIWQLHIWIWHHKWCS